MITSFVIYRELDGLILRQGTCPEEFLDEQILEGEVLLEWGDIGNCNYVVDGSPIYVPSPPLTLDEVKSAKRKEIRRSYENSFYVGYTTIGLTNNITVGCDRDSISYIERLLARMIKKGIPDKNIIDFYDVVQPNIPVADIQKISDELVDHSNDMYTYMKQKLKAVRNASTIEEVEAITW